VPNPPNIPGVSVSELPAGPRPIEPAPTSIAAFVGAAARGPVNEPVRITSFRDFEEQFGGLCLESTLGYAVRDFFANGGTEAIVVRLGGGVGAARQGLDALKKTAGFNLLCLPPPGDGRDLEPGLVSVAAQCCENQRAFLVLDAPVAWTDASSAEAGIAQGVGTTSANAAIYFPRLVQADPLHGNRPGTFASCGAVAGVMARTDAQRGVWKAPAGLEATLKGVERLAVALTDAEIGGLNAASVNCLRSLPAVGPTVWGAHTLQANRNPEWKYIPVRRLALFLEQSIDNGTKWAAFEPNGPPLWTQLRDSVSAFLTGFWRQGALQGTKPADAFFVKCDGETTTQNDIDNGVVNIVVGFAPLRPAEFVILRISQLAQS